MPVLIIRIVLLAQNVCKHNCFEVERKWLNNTMEMDIQSFHYFPFRRSLMENETNLFKYCQVVSEYANICLSKCGVKQPEKIMGYPHNYLCQKNLYSTTIVQDVI